MYSSACFDCAGVHMARLERLQPTFMYAALRVRFAHEKSFQTILSITRLHGS
jgi:hypothetical protein